MSRVRGFESRVIPVNEFTLPENLRPKLKILRKRFYQEAEVLDSETGYIRVEFMNRPPKIDQEMLISQADIISHFLRYCNPTRIVGIPNSGLPLTEQVARNFPTAKLVSSTKPNGAETNWENAVEFDVQSFTKRAKVTMAVEKIEAGERYLVIDDVAAWGLAANGFLTAIKEHGGIPVAYAVGFEKRFQKGIQVVAESHNIPSLAVISIVAIEGQKIRLSP